MGINYREKRLDEQQLGFKIPSRWDIHCQICEEDVSGIYIGFTPHNGSSWIYYNCPRCEETVTIKIEVLKDRLAVMSRKKLSKLQRLAINTI